MAHFLEGCYKYLDLIIHPYITAFLHIYSSVIGQTFVLVASLL